MTRASSDEAALGASSGQHGDQVDGLGDQRARDGDHRFLDQLLEPSQRTDGGPGMDRADAARMTGAPGLQQVQRFGAAHLADGDAIGPQPQRCAHQIGQGRDPVLGAQGHEVGGQALQLARVLDQDDAVRGLGDLRQQRIGQGRLAGRGAARDEDVGAAGDPLAQVMPPASAERSPPAT